MDDEKRSVWNTYPNKLTLLGVGLVALAFVGGFFLFLMEVTSERPSPYVGLNYIACSLLLVIGFVLIPIGIWHERRRRRQGFGVERSAELRIDFTSSRHVYAMLSLLAGAFVIILLVGIGANRSYEASESSEFCGEVCHTVMQPEWDTYHRSAHARVACAECHIGSGAGWYVRSKISGLRQVWATARGSYPRPIPTPIRDLRPARETCEECHWRRKFIGYKEQVHSYYLSDDGSEPHKLRMLVKIGGEKTSLQKGSGIHYHMLITTNVEYVALDEKRQEIAWVRVTRADGSVTEYESSDNPLPEDRDGLEVRTMDCMDCHNRPAHQFPSPVRSVNEALEEERLSTALPDIKVQAVTVLGATYPTNEAAMVGIADTLRDYYGEEHPEFLEGDAALLRGAIQEVQKIYQRTIFPEMKSSWSSYPDNIGHFESPGCFRCHNDAMESAQGQTIFTTCDRCHVILAQGDQIDRVDVNLEEGLPFVHPEDGEEMEDYEECSECHTGGADIYE